VPNGYSTRKGNRTVTLYLIILELWFRNLMARLRQASQPVRLTTEDIVPLSTPDTARGATEDWSPAEAVALVDGLVALEDVDMDEAYSEYWHHLFTCMEHAAVTDFNVGVNRALHKFGMTEKEMLGAAVLHEGSGEHELVPA
jgi:hypothetical protein